MWDENILFWTINKEQINGSRFQPSDPLTFLEKLELDRKPVFNFIHSFINEENDLICILKYNKASRIILIPSEKQNWNAVYNQFVVYIRLSNMTNQPFSIGHGSLAVSWERIMLDIWPVGSCFQTVLGLTG